MMLTKFALLTCALYLAGCVFLDMLILLWARFGREGMIGAKGWAFYAFFGVIWLVSFHFSAKIWMAMMRAR